MVLIFISHGLTRFTICKNELMINNSNCSRSSTRASEVSQKHSRMKVAKIFLKKKGISLIITTVTKRNNSSSFKLGIRMLYCIHCCILLFHEYHFLTIIFSFSFDLEFESYSTRSSSSCEL